MTLNDNPEQVDSSSLSKSENLTCASLSTYECDSEGEDGWSDIDSDAGTRRTHKINSKFQLDAARAGECCDFRLPVNAMVNHIT